MAILHVTEVEVASAENYELNVRFDDGTRRRVRLGALLEGCFAPLRDPERFAEVYVAAPGVPTWPTTVKPEGAPDEEAMELDLAPEALKEAPGEELPQRSVSAA
ncbi:MAG: hypothetical protein BRD48_06870 [Bacteroidetes bacterium QS_9_68_14]|jgi:hypothetical protein|nr:MAG: hypothetical protein BRD48_06870 [Bacteroidetes bacterium QS_9_68_14]